MSKQTDLLNLTDAITVDSSNNVGIGTSSPSTILTLKRDSAGTSENQYPLLSLDNGNANGFSQLRFADDGAEIASIFSNSADKYLVFRAGGATERMRIDSSGRVTMPYQPSFYAYRATAGSTTYNAGDEVVFPQVKYNVGGHYNTSNGRFTAPVAGIYIFTAAVYNTGSSYSRWTFRLNSSAAIAGQGGIHTSGDQVTLAVSHFLNANDYVSLSSNYAGQVLFHDVDHTSITGYFLG